MRGLSEREVLRAWERCQGEHPLDQALSLILSAEPEIDRAEAAELPIGSRDARLLALYETLFGPTLDVFAECPECSTAVEFSAAVKDLRMPAPSVSRLSVTVEGKTFECRLPNSRDLAAIAYEPSEKLAVLELVRRCAVGAAEVDLTEQNIEAIGQALAEADPASDVLFALRCPACEHEWSALFDALPFVLSGFKRIASRALNDVHELASAYGWSEDQILALDARRRSAYLELVHA